MFFVNKKENIMELIKSEIFYLLRLVVILGNIWGCYLWGLLFGKLK